MDEQNRLERQIVGERLWLEYFNRCALAEGAITEQEYCAMQNQILKREADQKKKRHIKGRER